MKCDTVYFCLSTFRVKNFGFKFVKVDENTMTFSFDVFYHLLNRIMTIKLFSCFALDCRSIHPLLLVLSDTQSDSCDPSEIQVIMPALLYSSMLLDPVHP